MITTGLGDNPWSSFSLRDEGVAQSNQHLEVMLVLIHESAYVDEKKIVINKSFFSAVGQREY